MRGRGGVARGADLTLTPPHSLLLLIILACVTCRCGNYTRGQCVAHIDSVNDDLPFFDQPGGLFVSFQPQLTTHNNQLCCTHVVISFHTLYIKSVSLFCASSALFVIICLYYFFANVRVLLSMMIWALRPRSLFLLLIITFVKWCLCLIWIITALSLSVMSNSTDNC